MARITVEKCLTHINNHFDLVLEASRRARQIDIGKFEPSVPWNNDKPSVVALREIALGDLYKQNINSRL
jgi:DNA-directed RNA polymerase subunit omega